MLSSTSKTHTTSELISINTRIILYLFSLSTLFFSQNYCTNVCRFIDGLTGNELRDNLLYIFFIHIVARELLYHRFSTPFKGLSLPRHTYYLSIISWFFAGIAAFLLHYIKYPEFPLGSHLKLFSSYLVLGAAILAQLEYIIFEKRYKEIATNTHLYVYNESISRRIAESFLILTIAPSVTILLIIARYSQDGIYNEHMVSEIAYILLLFLVSAVVFSIFFGKMLKKDTKEIVEKIEDITEGSYKIDINVQRADELGKISNAIEDMAFEIGKLNEDITSTQAEVVNMMGEVAETRSKETGQHVKRVAKYSELLALKYGLHENEAKLLKQASPMHDIGKIGIPDNILNKPGRHTEEEFIIMKTHSQLGYEILKGSDRPILKAASIVAYEHHEKYDGSGYPRGISADNIHIYGRITAVADVFDALGSDRVYKKAWDDERIFNLLKEESGKHFDPKLIEIFFDNLDEFLHIRDTHKDKIN